MSLLLDEPDDAFLAEVAALEAQHHASTALSTAAASNLPQQPAAAPADAAAVPRSPLQPRPVKRKIFMVMCSARHLAQETLLQKLQGNHNLFEFHLYGNDQFFF